MHFVLQTDTRSRNKVYSYYICMYLISCGGERMWLLTKEGKTLEESDHVWHVQRSEPAAGSHKISHCGAVTCENPSVAIIKPPKQERQNLSKVPPNQDSRTITTDLSVVKKTWIIPVMRSVSCDRGGNHLLCMRTMV